MKCRKFDYNLYFKMEELIASISDKDLSPGDIYKMCKKELSDKYGLEVTSKELKNYFVNSAIANKSLKQLLTYDDSVKVDEAAEATAVVVAKSPVTTKTGEEKTTKESVTINRFIEKKLPGKTKITSRNDVYENYFSGSMLQYNRFRTEFAKRVFQAGMISFDVNNHYIIENNEDITNNIAAYKEELIKILSDYLISKDIQPADNAVGLMIQIHELGITNNDAFNNDELLKVYNAYVALAHFDDLIKLYNDTIRYNRTTRQYELLIEHKVKNNFSDNPIDLMDEVSKITRTLIEFTPIIDSKGEPVKGKYLKLNQLISVINKFKSADSVFNMSTGIRFNPEENISKLMRDYLEHPEAYAEYNFDSHDLEIIRSIYNAFYKDGSESSSVLSQLDHNTVSLLQIKNETHDTRNYSSYNILTDAITAIIDKTIEQRYVTLEETAEGITRTLTRDITVNRYLNEFKRKFNGYVSNSFVEDDVITIKDKSVFIKIGTGAVSTMINPLAKFSSGQIQFEINNLLSKAELDNYIERGTLPTDIAKANYIEALNVISRFTGLKFFANNGELLRSISARGKTFIEEGLYVCARMQYFKKLNEDYNKTRVEKPNLTLSDFLLSKGILFEGKEIYGNRLTPFTEISTVEFFKEISQATALVKGDTSAAVSRNLNGDGLPNSSILNLIGDHKTVFAMHKEASLEDALSGNFFVQAGNVQLLGQPILRSDIKMLDGTIKNAKKFNSSEICCQAMFSDFWSNAYNIKGKNGIVMMEPTVFADKTGQAMIPVNLNEKINFLAHDNDGNVIFSITGKTLFEVAKEGKLDELHYYSMQEQYRKLFNKLSSDYIFLVDNMLLDNANMVDDVTVSQFVQGVLNGSKTVSFDAMSAIIKRININNYRKNGDKSIDVQAEFHYTYEGVNGLLIKKFKEYGIMDGSKAYYDRRMKREDLKMALTYENLLKNTVIVGDDGKLNPVFANAIVSYLVNIKGVSEGKLDAAIEEFIKEWTHDDGTLKIYKGSKFFAESDIYKPINDLEVNPIIEIFQQMNRVVMGNYNLAMIGGAYAHSMKVNRSDINKMFDPDLHDEAYENNAQKYIYDDLVKSLGSKEAALQEIWEEVEESARTLAMFKRMVSYQAKMHSFTQGLFDGVPRDMKMMVMKDISRKVWNSIGTEDKFDVADGGGYISMVASLIYRNSLGDTGSDTVSLKAIRHALDSDTAVAHLDKYAIQAVTNESMRQTTLSKRPWENLNKIMLDSIKFNEVFPSEVGNLFDAKYQLRPDKAVLIASLPEGVDEAAFMKEQQSLPSFLTGKNIKSSIEGTGIISTLEAIVYDPSTGDYLIKKSFVGPNSNDMGITTENGYIQIEGAYCYKRVKLNSLYDIWQEVLGGMYSIREDPNSTQMTSNGVNYSYGEDSNEALALFINNIVIHKDGFNADSIKQPNQSNFYQPLKDALIWQINNASGMKNGAKNVNSNDITKNVPERPEFFITDSMHYGIQGNFDHKFSEDDEAQLSESSQLISLAETNGFMTNDVDRLYKSLASIINHSMSGEAKALLAKDGSIAEFFARKIINAMSTKDRLGLAQAWSSIVSQAWDEKIKNNENTNYSELDFKIAFSDPNFYGALISTISGALNNGTIKRKIAGLSCVISQGDDSIMVVEDMGTVKLGNALYKEKVKALMTEFKAKYEAISEEPDTATRAFALTELKNEFNKNMSEYKAALNSGQYGENTKRYNIDYRSINAYDTYCINFKDGYIYFTIDNIDDYYKAKRGDFSFIKGFDTDLSFQITRVENVPRNLKPARVVFRAEGKDLELNEMDLDSSLAIYYLKDAILGKAIPDYAMKLIDETGIPLEAQNYETIRTKLIIRHQADLKNVQEGKFLYQGNLLDGESYVAKGEVVMPNYNMHKFGIREGEMINDINFNYFYKKFYDYKKKTLRSDFRFVDKYGDHLYLLNNDEWSSMVSVNTIEEVSFKKKIIDGVEYFVDASNNIVCEALPDVDIMRVNGNLIMRYDGSVDTVHKLFSTGYFAGIEYDFNEQSFDKISEYINKYDIHNRRYLQDGFYKGLQATYEDNLDGRYGKFCATVHDSWQKQLDTLGIRIPAQSLQSIMAMKIVGFTETSVNRAYLPIKKNSLDGSDFRLK